MQKPWIVQIAINIIPKRCPITCNNPETSNQYCCSQGNDCSEQAAESRQRLRINVSGRVQGVGFRPTVYRYAEELKLAGTVRNDSRGVVIEVEGQQDKIRDFVDRLTASPPPQADIQAISEQIISLHNETEFRIIKSSGAGELAVGMPPDLAVCDDCVKELFDPSNRRYRYPFLNCTNCGPRFSIIQGLPYDRDKTSMSSFRMCELCQAEYNDPANRRFDAQPNACPDCGPTLELRDADEEAINGDAITETSKRLKRGSIIAIKGLGGFHLSCSALDKNAIQKLRQRKSRPSKALAVMFRDVSEIARHCYVDESDRAELLSSACPIVILQRRSTSDLPTLISPDTEDIGAFLPYTPLHHLLLADESPLVMTSANLRDEPIAMTTEHARRLLGTVADYILDHNREIIRRCDDSVVKKLNGSRILLRRSRGFVPNPVALSVSSPPVLACGGDLKNTFCITRENQAFLSQYIGDLEEYSAYQFFTRAVSDFHTLLDVSPAIIACDMHPDYKSSEVARSMAAGDKDIVTVQHHHAHIASCMTENGVTDKVIGVALDGTGYGADGTMWGGEFLVADLQESQRAGHFSKIALPGGDTAVKYPGRIALSMLYNAGFDILSLDDSLAPLTISAEERQVILQMIENGINSPLTPSAGRLFDGVSAMLGLCHSITYEGQAAIRLQNIADQNATGCYRYDISNNILDFAPAVSDIVYDLTHGIDKANIAGKFHNTVASGSTDLCGLLSREFELTTVALSGGVFQNEFIVEKVCKLLESNGFTVLLHTEVPPNDECVALGQAAVASARSQT